MTKRHEQYVGLTSIMMNLKNEETASQEGNDLLFIDTLLLLNHNTTILYNLP